MPRPKKDPTIRITAYELFREGKGPTPICEALRATFGEDAVSERTVATWVKGFKELNQPVIDLDSPFQWSQMDQYGLPWEASAYIMDIRYDFEKFREALRRVQESNRQDERVIDRHLTAREAIWCWRVHQAAPEIGAAVGCLTDVRHLAIQFAFRELARDVLAEPLDIAGLEATLVYKPWLNVERHLAYHSAVDEGVIPPLPRHHDAMRKALRVSRGPAKTLAEAEARRKPGVDATVSEIIFSPYPDEHRELLESQQSKQVAHGIRLD